MNSICWLVGLPADQEIVERALGRLTIEANKRAQEQAEPFACRLRLRQILRSPDARLVQ
jgi:hypothetical protein